MDVNIEDVYEVIKRYEPDIELIQDQVYKHRYWLIDKKTRLHWFKIDNDKANKASTFTMPAIRNEETAAYLITEFKKSLKGVEKTFATKMKSFEKYFRKNI